MLQVMLHDEIVFITEQAEILGSKLLVGVCVVDIEGGNLTICSLFLQSSFLLILLLYFMG